MFAKEDIVYSYTRAQAIKMNWLTEKEIKVAAKKSKRAAINCTIKHWEQLVAAGWREYRGGSRKGQVGIGLSYCALCLRYQNKDIPCPLSSKLCQGYCVSEWHDVVNEEWSPKRWLIAVRVMLAKLKSLKTG